jgi:hypothetical protein
MSNELYSFVKESLEKGQKRSAIMQALLAAGWQEEEIQKGLDSFAKVDFPIAVPKPKPYIQAKEAFLYLISFIALYISSFSFGVVVFAFIDKLFPDPVLRGVFFARGITTALASIMIAFPLYLFMIRFIGKAAAKDPERRQSKVGKWLTYITLVIAAGIIIGDLIAVLSNLLGGDLTSRFMLKALTVLAIAGSIFGYYLWGLQKEEQEKQEKVSKTQKPLGLRIFTGVVTFCMVLAVLYGLFLVGTPAQQRLLQFDERRVSDLQSITFAIDSYWERNENLPQTLEDLHNPLYYMQSVVDPKTGIPYEYRIVSSTGYELCAVFETDSSQTETSRLPVAFPKENSFWHHKVGRTCFSIEVRQPAKEGIHLKEELPQ